MVFWSSLLLLVSSLTSSFAEIHEFNMRIEEGTTDLYNLNEVAIIGYASKFNPINESTENVRYTMTVNGVYPGPMIDVMAGDIIRLNIENTLGEHPTILHLHG